MDWITGIQKAIDYIESHITEELDYQEIAENAFSSPWHFQRVFSILCGYTLGEYIRSRRLALAGAELAADKIRVIDAAVKYGYDSPDSFTKAFTRFHGITPSAAREPGAKLCSFTRLSIRISLKGGSSMEYRIEEKPEMVLTGYKRFFTGTPAERADQEEDFYVTTRLNQYVLKGLAGDNVTNYGVMTNFRDEGYDFYIAARLGQWEREHLEEELGNAEDAKRFENIAIPARTYVICETRRCQYPTMIFSELRKKIVEEWLPSSGYLLADSPEISVYHWFRKPDNEKRYIELWLPVERENKERT
ncbi:MAG: AraC family transcriptional regulator [Lachnospiraceae bacterium]|nr:AraC family transcriptional regulator [Lachnospiraceae bacterium]